MRPLPNEPTQQEIEELEVDEELEFVHVAPAPPEVRSDVLQRIERIEEQDLEDELLDEPPPAR